MLSLFLFSALGDAQSADTFLRKAQAAIDQYHFSIAAKYADQAADSSTNDADKLQALDLRLRVASAQRDAKAFRDTAKRIFTVDPSYKLDEDYHSPGDRQKFEALRKQAPPFATPTLVPSSPMLQNQALSSLAISAFPVSSAHRLRKWSYVAAGLSLGALLGGLALKQGSRTDIFAIERLSSHPSGDDPTVARLLHQSSTKSDAATGLFVASGVAGSAAVSLFFW